MFACRQAAACMHTGPFVESPRPGFLQQAMCRVSQACLPPTPLLLALLPELSVHALTEDLCISTCEPQHNRMSPEPS